LGCQILSAVFPGTSRSMSTIAAGQIVGLSRPAALEFSFFLSMPTMVVATLYDLYKTLKPSRNTLNEGNLAPLAVDPHQWVVARIWIRRFVHRRACRGRVVHAVGANKGICAICGLPNRPCDRSLDFANARFDLNQWNRPKQSSRPAKAASCAKTSVASSTA